MRKSNWKAQALLFHWTVLDRRDGMQTHRILEWVLWQHVATGQLFITEARQAAEPDEYVWEVVFGPLPSSLIFRGSSRPVSGWWLIPFRQARMSVSKQFFADTDARRFWRIARMDATPEYKKWRIAWEREQKTITAAS